MSPANGDLRLREVAVSARERAAKAQLDHADIARQASITVEASRRHRQRAAELLEAIERGRARRRLGSPLAAPGSPTVIRSG